MWRSILVVCALMLGTAPPLAAEAWQDVVSEARGQTVYWNAWGGDDEINDYIGWVGQRVEDRFGVEVVHVKLTDTGEAVSRVLAEKAAGRSQGGRIDLVWINGENFHAMKRQDLLYGPFTERLPNFRLVDIEDKPTTLVDFTVPTEGYESPWGMSQFVFLYDSASVDTPPRSIEALGEWARAHPGRFTYPAPPDFLGSTFLKHVLLAFGPDPEVLAAPADQQGQDVAGVIAPVFDWLEGIRPDLWREGESYPLSGPAQNQLLADGEVDFSMAFHPGEASAGIAAGRLPETIRTFILDGGTIGNTHFVAIPFNAAHKAGAMVVANFLLSPEAQAKKQHPDVWGDQTVLDLDALPPGDRRLFDDLPHGVATLPPEALTPVLPEPHPTWMEALEAEWLRRFSS